MKAHQVETFGSRTFTVCNVLFLLWQPEVTQSVVGCLVNAKLCLNATQRHCFGAARKSYSLQTACASPLRKKSTPFKPRPSIATTMGSKKQRAKQAKASQQLPSRPLMAAAAAQGSRNTTPRCHCAACEAPPLKRSKGDEQSPFLRLPREVSAARTERQQPVLTIYRFAIRSTKSSSSLVCLKRTRSCTSNHPCPRTDQAQNTIARMP